jgi:F0F1-type ATP synthase membrane subunit b/b'
MAAKATTRAAPAQAPAKSMRQLNKENEDLQAQVDQLTSSLQSVHAGKQAVKLSYEVCAQAKLGVAHGRAPISPRTPPRTAAFACGNHTVHARGFSSPRASPPSLCVCVCVCVCLCVCLCVCVCVCVLSPVQKAAQEKEARIAQLQGEIDAQKAGSERELSNVSSALSRATEEAREKGSQAEEAQTALEKLNLRVNEYQACLERVGVNAVSLKVCVCVCLCLCLCVCVCV